MEVVAATFRRTSESGRLITSQGLGHSAGPFLVHPSALTTPLRGHMHTDHGHLNSDASTLTSCPWGVK